MNSQKTLTAMIQESFISESPMNKLRALLDDDEKRALEQILRSTAGVKPFVESTAEMSSFETVLLVTTLRQSLRIERLELLLQRLTARVLELYASQENVPDQTRSVSRQQTPEHTL